MFWSLVFGLKCKGEGWSVQVVKARCDDGVVWLVAGKWEW